MPNGKMLDRVALLLIIAAKMRRVQTLLVRSGSAGPGRFREVPFLSDRRITHKTITVLP